MKREIAIACVALSGCATTWGMTQASDSARIWDEDVHEIRVPMDDVTETLTVALPLAIEYYPGTKSATGQQITPPKALPFALQCSTQQSAHDVRYHQAFRYGSFWKKSTAVFFVLEAASAAALLLADGDQPEGQVFGGFFAIDAAVTGALFFAPRKDIYRHDVVPIETGIRSDCPDGLELAIGNTVLPIDAAGHPGDLGNAAIDDWMKAPNGTIEVRFSGVRQPLEIDDAARCTWRREHHVDTCNPGPWRSVSAILRVPPGTLTTFALR
jgi:hypothetical protein